MHDIVIKDALYFPSSPVNVVSVAKLSLQYGDGVSIGDQGTWIKTTHGTSWFSWDAEMFHKTILHPISNLPEIVVNERALESHQMSFFTKTLDTVTSYWKSKSEGASHVLLVDANKCAKPSDLVDKEVATESKWQDEDDYLHGFTVDDIPRFKCGDKLLYIRDGDVRDAFLKSITTDPSRLQLLYNIEFNDKSTLSVTKEFLLPSDY